MGKVEIKTEKTKEKIKFCVYSRVSTLLPGQESSFKTQEEDLKKAVIASHPDFEYYRGYSDKVSGTKGKEERPGFEEMLEDARSHKFSVIVAKNISRIARNTKVFLDTLEELQKYGIRLILPEDGIDTNGAANKFYITILAALAEMEAENTRAHIQETFALKRANDLPARPSAICLGYKLQKNEETGKSKVVVDPEQEELVKKIFKWFVEDGYGAGTIAKMLNRQGIESPRVHKSRSSKGPKKWHRSSIKYILKNEKYLGIVIEHKKDKDKKIVQEYRFEDAYPPIIDEITFNKAKEIMKARDNSEQAKKMRDNRSNFAANLYPLSGIVYCKDCGDKCTRYSNHADYHKRLPTEDPCNGNPLWGCMSGGVGRSQPTYCGNYKISEYYLYKMIIYAIAVTLLEKNIISEFSDKIGSLKADEINYENELKAYNANIAQQQASFKRLKDLFIEGTIEKPEFDLRKAKIDREIKQLELHKPVQPEVDRSSLAKAVELLSTDIVKTNLNLSLSYLSKLFLDPESKRAIVRALVEKIVIGGVPKYRADIKLRGCDEMITLTVTRRSPYRRHMRDEETGKLKEVLVEDPAPCLCSFEDGSDELYDEFEREGLFDDTDDRDFLDGYVSSLYPDDE